MGGNSGRINLTVFLSLSHQQTSVQHSSAFEHED